MKIFAYYLPQFHCIPENDQWWGKGFTEWTNVKKAEKLFASHRQPKEPLGDNYYSLLNRDTLCWQAKLANDYGVDGFVFYHYYFRGKLLLEKPAELLLKDDGIPMHFFFCWANHSWYRTWEGTTELLQEQTYGGEEAWEKHFMYLLPFFQDVRYEKRDGKPLLMIFKPHFAEKKAMLAYFNKRCIESGFNGLCVIETVEGYDNEDILKGYIDDRSECTEFIHLREPGTSRQTYYVDHKYFWQRIRDFRVFVRFRKSLADLGIGKYVVRFDGNRLFDVMLRERFESKMILRGLFFEWDNTPRHGYRGHIITPPNKNKVFAFLDSVKNDEYVFVNAWNEWCEGMILEPTKENGYKYLEWIQEWTEKHT